MANSDRPSGFKPVGHLDGSPYNGAFNIYYVPDTDSDALYLYDMVMIAGSGDTLGKYPTVKVATTNASLLGSIVGFGTNPEQMYNTSSLSTDYRAASTAMYVAVADSPDIVFEAQEDSAGSNLDADALETNADIVVGAGSTTTGLSGHEIDSSDTKTGTAQIRILRLVPRDDNELGTNAKWLCYINEHQRKSTTGA